MYFKRVSCLFSGIFNDNSFFLNSYINFCMLWPLHFCIVYNFIISFWLCNKEYNLFFNVEVNLNQEERVLPS